MVDTLDLLDETNSCQRRIRIGTNNEMEIYKNVNDECVIELTNNTIPLKFKNSNGTLMSLNSSGVSIDKLTTGTHVENIKTEDLLIELGTTFKP